MRLAASRKVPREHPEEEFAPAGDQIEISGDNELQRGDISSSNSIGGDYMDGNEYHDTNVND